MHGAKAEFGGRNSELRFLILLLIVILIPTRILTVRFEQETTEGTENGMSHKLCFLRFLLFKSWPPLASKFTRF